MPFDFQSVTCVTDSQSFIATEQVCTGAIFSQHWPKMNCCWLPLLLLILQKYTVQMDRIERNQDCGWNCSEVCQFLFTFYFGGTFFDDLLIIINLVYMLITLSFSKRLGFHSNVSIRISWLSLSSSLDFIRSLTMKNEVFVDIKWIVDLQM